MENDEEVTKKEFIDSLDEAQNYNSLRKSYFEIRNSKTGRSFSTEESEIAESNDFLSSILNEDGLVIIGDHFYKVNLSSEKVFVLNTQFANQLTDLKQENTGNENILVFSTSDDVLDLISEGTKGTVNGRTELFCRDRHASGKEKVKDVQYTDWTAAIEYQVKAKHVYQKAGIYFSLLTELKHMDRHRNYGSILWTPSNTEIYVDYYFKWKQRCRSGDHEDRGWKETLWDNKLNYRAYERTRGLEKIQIESRYIYLQRNVDTGGSDAYLTIPTIIDGY